MNDLGKWLLIIGGVIMLVGLLVQTGWLSWFGRLPGDIRIERPNVSFYFPITSMVIASIVVSALAYLVRRFS
jgi:membrane protein implicated in regulation of membrane protease activity